MAKKETEKKEEKAESTPTVVHGETCPICHNKTLTLAESDIDIPFFGVTYLFSMNCSSCGYHKADIEADEQKPPIKVSIDIDSEKDMKIRVIKSSNATVKIPHIGTIEPGEISNGYITNVEGILQRFKKMTEVLRDDAEDKADQKKAKNMIKKITRVIWGQDKVKLTIEDPSGNSAIISDKAVKKKL
ncbi:MAG: ZPR1 zinc finger domain-containing protein [Nanoarchaeota archaeon]|nr:ZPR1 zinc finger domain-containing protein [Nanoarchaeota archaeon]MBU1322002.1 ZPR1 zinc finger domain-containing protein [Nanoarchaeota archaeon]MBU1598087.1 ZPR1 zinc finger domain-containing protein [Nanoarchaeota archaeon]MBU2441784.1 ZPR1 zinc finger domain-containing protein [Nanoarchaeota archaeon]